MISRMARIIDGCYLYVYAMMNTFVSAAMCWIEKDTGFVVLLGCMAVNVLFALRSQRFRDARTTPRVLFVLSAAVLCMSYVLWLLLAPRRAAVRVAVCPSTYCANLDPRLSPRGPSPRPPGVSRSRGSTRHRPREEGPPKESPVASPWWI
jgi:hypothetical protein